MDALLMLDYVILVVDLSLLAFHIMRRPRLASNRLLK